MRLGFWGAAAAAVLGSFISVEPAFAQASSAATEATRPQPGQAGVVRALEALAPADGDEAGWLSELSGLYAAPGAPRYWTTTSGLSARGEALRREIAAGDLYGLDPTEFDLPDAGVAVDEAEAMLSFAAAKYTWHARGGRVDPAQLSLWLDQTPRQVYASTIVRQIGESDDVVAALRAQHPRHPQFESLRQALLRARGLIAEEKPVPLLSGPKIVLGERHLDVGIIRRRLGLAYDHTNDTLADDGVIEAVRSFMRQAGYGKKKRVIDDEVRNAINAANDKPRDNKALIEKIVINMERWRWVPPEFGKVHVWNNLPEYESRIVKDGEVVHRERIIIGQPHTQTPVFSDSMSQVVFQPTWGLPPSIKLQKFSGHIGNMVSALEARGMYVPDDNGNPIRATRIRWAKADLRNVPIVQGPGPGNPLGRLKFVFPNAHSVYMHDTPDKYLFNSTDRAFSHGCMRVRNPERYAEVVLGLTRGWTAADVAKQLTDKRTTKIQLPENIPVHVTYFTLLAEENGSLRSLKDVYGHDQRIAEALSGVPFAKIAARDPALAQLRQNEELARKAGARVSKRSRLAANPAPRKPGQRAQARTKPFALFN